MLIFKCRMDATERRCYKMQNININKLKGKIVESGLTVAALAEKMGIDRATLYRKLSNNGDTMLVKDANCIVSVLNLTEDEAVAIFFSQFVA